MSSRRIVENSRDPRTIRKLDAGVVIRHDHTLELKGGGVVVDKNIWVLNRNEESTPLNFFTIICKSDVICHGHAESYCFMSHPIDSKNYFP